MNGHRRQFLKVVGGGAGALLPARGGHAHHDPTPMPQSLPYLDQKMYIHNYVVSTPALGKPILEPMSVSEWSLPGLNAGAP